MAGRSEKSLNAAMEAQLQLVYGDERASALLPQIARLVDRWRPSIHARRPWLDQRDAMLITYADTLQEPDVAPLASLARFLAERAAICSLPSTCCRSSPGPRMTAFR